MSRKFIMSAENIIPLRQAQRREQTVFKGGNDASLQATVSSADTLSSDILALGMAEIDDHLPAGGLLLDAIHEIIPENFTARAAAYGFLVALLSRLMAQKSGLVVFCDFQRDTSDRMLPFAPGLTALGLDPARLIYVRPRHEKEFFWALEEALSCSQLMAVIGIMGQESLYDFTESKRLNLRAKSQGKPLFLMRPAGSGGASASATRWQVSPSKSPANSRLNFPLPEFGAPSWRLDLLRAKGASPKRWEVGWNHETLCFHMASSLARRTPVAPDRARPAFG